MKRFKRNPYESKKRKYNAENILKIFKYLFIVLIKLNCKAPMGWDIRNEEDIGELSDIINKQFS